ncbi:hypothetical protein LBMAG56_47150 [Verrucomicrobiota bacterium]|nr:hypothetical protein LBMAG56_47150 [Verrucomicrobiota bacterium]
MTLLLRLPALAAAISLLTTAAPAAQPKAGTVAKADAELAAAKKQVTEAQHKLTESQKDLQKAEAAHAPAVAKLQRERQKATQEHGAKLGLFQAIAERDALHRQTSTVFDSVVTAFKGSSEYKSAAEAAAKASEQLKAVREDESLAEAKKAQLTSEHSATIRRPAELERARLDADPKLLEARQREGEAAKKVAALQPQVTKAVESDPDVVAALKHEREAAPRITKAREDVAHAQKELATAQATLARETKQHADAQQKNAKKPKK